MERLTEYIGEGEYKVAKPKGSVKVNSQKCFEKLARYEDLMDELSEIIDSEEYGFYILSESIKILIRECVKTVTEKLPVEKAMLLTYETCEEWEKYREDKGNGLLVRLPCKVGDTLYEPGRKQISEYKVKAIRVGVFAIWIEWDIEKGICFSRIDGVKADEIGKTVFLTKAETEAKLKEMEGENAN